MRRVLDFDALRKFLRQQDELIINKNIYMRDTSAMSLSHFEKKSITGLGLIRSLCLVSTEVAENEELSQALVTTLHR